MFQARASQLTSAGLFEITVNMTDSDAKQVMTSTPNVTMAVGGKMYGVNEVNPRVIPNEYVVRLRTGLLNGVNKDAPVVFGIKS